MDEEKRKHAARRAIPSREKNPHSLSCIAALRINTPSYGAGTGL